MVYLTPRQALKEITFKKEPFILEIGFGNGAFLRWLWENIKGKIVGIDIANIAFEKARSRLFETEVLTVKAEARFFLKYMVPPETLQEVYILFPDPWPKKKKRRLMEPVFARLLSSRMIKGGRVFVATDDEDYFEQMKDVLSEIMKPVPWDVPVATKYLEKWKRMGRSYKSLCFENTAPMDFSFEAALERIELEDVLLEEGMIFKESFVVKVDEAYEGKRGWIYKVIFSEMGFSHKYFFLKSEGILRSLNTWGEVFPPSLEHTLKQLASL